MYWGWISKYLYWFVSTNNSFVPELFKTKLPTLWPLPPILQSMSHNKGLLLGEHTKFRKLMLMTLYPSVPQTPFKMCQLSQ